MKKILPLILLGAVVGLSGCNSKKSELKYSYIKTTSSLVTSNETGSFVIADANYEFDVEFYESVGTLSISNILVDNTPYSFSGPSQSCRSLDGGYVIFTNPQGYFNNNTSLTAQDSKIMFTSAYYIPGATSEPVPGYPFTVGNPYKVVAKYNIGDLFTVRTFQEDAVYVGKTYTQYESQGQTVNEETETIAYRAVLDLEKKKAAIILYNAKFAQAMPDAIPYILVENLDLTFNSNGYTITGENVIPKIPDGDNAAQEIPRYIFNKLSFTTASDDLIKCNITYDVANNMYHGEFSGEYILQF